jgi:hypothetical protein
MTAWAREAIELSRASGRNAYVILAEIRAKHEAATKAATDALFNISADLILDAISVNLQAPRLPGFEQGEVP